MKKKKKKDERRKELHAMEEQYRDWFTSMPYPIIIDSGAAESVMPHGWCPQAALLKGEAYGKSYSAANGSIIKNKGEKVISMITRNGKWKSMKFEMCDMTRPLASVHKIVEAGHTVVFNPSWKGSSYILNLQTQEKTRLMQKDGVFVLETKIAITKLQNNVSFGRQGR